MGDRWLAMAAETAPCGCGADPHHRQCAVVAVRDALADAWAAGVEEAARALDRLAADYGAEPGDSAWWQMLSTQHAARYVRALVREPTP
jgi:hypothetical protein